MEDYTKRLSSLSPEQRRLFELRRKKQALKPSKRQILPRSRQSNIFPLSFAQQRLWFLDQLEPGNPFYNEPVALRLKGILHVMSLEQSLNEITRRHEALRTTFVAVEGYPMQVIASDVYVPLLMVDLQMLSEEEIEFEVQRLITLEARQPFDLAHKPPIRAAILRLKKEEHVLLLTTHHIASDGWSKGVFMRELTALYASFSAGKPSPLSELSIQYADFAAWQRDWLQGELLESQLAYWKQQLCDMIPLLELPTDRPRPAVQTFCGATHYFVLPKLLTEALKALSQREGVTLFMTLLAAFQMLLSRYSGQTDIVVASPIANRMQTEVEGLIGLFANTLVLRTDLSGDPPFKQLLKRVRQVALDAYSNQDVPFERLVEELRPSRDTSYNPLFQVMFQLQNVPMPKPELAGLTLHQIDIDNKTAVFDLVLMLEDTEQGLLVTVEYNTELFDAATIYRMSAHYQSLLKEASANSDRHLSDFTLLTEAERRQILVTWNATEADYPKDRCLHHLFEYQVEQTPEAIAVIYKNERISYRELNRRANQLAHHLHTIGVGPEVRVGICVERSLDLVVGFLGILKAGGAYVPLDPSYPQDRLAFMLQDAQVPVLLTQYRLLEHLPTSAINVVCLDTDWYTNALMNEKNLESSVTPDNLAYLIYTSGSTGHPKGVMLDHRGRVNNFVDYNRRFAIGLGDSVLVISSPSFDMCAYDTLGVLMSGGTIVLPEAALERDPVHWADLMVRHKVSIWHSVPALLEMLYEHLSGYRDLVPYTLRLVLLGGDWIPITLPEQLRSLLPDLEVVSLGGATESSVDSTVHSIEEIDPNWKSIPYGRPMANQSCYVLDAHLQAVPVGVPGELHLGGIGLAWGYLHCPDLTAQKFIPHPFGNEPGARLYKTGDLARYRPDGSLELLGRIDFQVKIHGLRIELGEIEVALKQLPRIREALVAARTDVAGNQRLVAYIVPADGYTLAEDEIKHSLNKMLPNYMVPTAFVLLQALPLTPNGKVDRRNLPEPKNEGSKQAVGPR